MHDVLLGLGSNSDPDKNIVKAIDQLNSFCSHIKLSPCYLTTAIDPSHPDYLNLVVQARTELDIDKLLLNLKSLESLQGRQKGIHCTLDIDLLCYNQIITEHPVTLPHQDLELYAHVLKPASELCPNKQHPSLGYTYIELWNKKAIQLLENQTICLHSLTRK